MEGIKVKNGEHGVRPIGGGGRRRFEEVMAILSKTEELTMHNPNNYIHYTDFGYDEDADWKKKRNIETISICIVTVFLILFFSISARVNNIYNDLINMERNVNSAFEDVQSAMRNRFQKISDLTKIDDEVNENIKTIIGDVYATRADLESCTTPEELDAVNVEITNKVDKVSSMIEKYPEITESGRYRSLIKQIQEAEKEIYTAREDYNMVTSEYNKLLGDFPYSLVAKMKGFETKEQFEVDEATS